MSVKMVPSQTEPGALDLVADPPARQPAVTYYPERKLWNLKADYSCQWEGHTLTVTAPFWFDLSSVPRGVWPLIAPFELGIRAPLFHDWLYRFGGDPPEEEGSIEPPRTYVRSQADELFRQHMLEDGVPGWRVRLAYRAVRWFGSRAWRD